jgi:hypothetical protein
MEVSVSAVLALLAAAPAAVLAAVKPLFPMKVVLNKGSAGMEVRERCRSSGARGRGRWRRSG